MKKFLKILLIIIVGLGILGAVLSDDENTGGNTTNSEKMYTLNQTGNTGYFDVTINEFAVLKSVNTGNEFTKLKAEEGSKYFAMNLTFKNTDNESRMVPDGVLEIIYNGKLYKFDKSETVFSEGWGTLEQLNPLLAKTTNIAYKIPEEITGEAYYVPGRNVNKIKFSLGEIKK
ncbi:MAG: DUF4352 domain-containing protein [Cetobacterium sp.]